MHCIDSSPGQLELQQFALGTLFFRSASTQHFEETHLGKVFIGQRPALSVGWLSARAMDCAVPRIVFHVEIAFFLKEKWDGKMA